MDLERLAKRLYDLVPWYERDGETVADVVKMMEKDPLYFIEWLLDYIDENGGD